MRCLLSVQLADHWSLDEHDIEQKAQKDEEADEKREEAGCGEAGKGKGEGVEMKEQEKKQMKY